MNDLNALPEILNRAMKLMSDLQGRVTKLELKLDEAETLGSASALPNLRQLNGWKEVLGRPTIDKLPEEVTEIKTSVEMFNAFLNTLQGE